MDIVFPLILIIFHRVANKSLIEARLVLFPTHDSRPIPPYLLKFTSCPGTEEFCSPTDCWLTPKPILTLTHSQFHEIRGKNAIRNASKENCAIALVCCNHYHGRQISLVCVILGKSRWRDRLLRATTWPLTVFVPYLIRRLTDKTQHFLLQGERKKERHIRQ